MGAGTKEANMVEAKHYEQAIGYWWNSCGKMDCDDAVRWIEQRARELALAEQEKQEMVTPEMVQAALNSQLNLEDGHTEKFANYLDGYDVFKAQIVRCAIEAALAAARVATDR